jgi:hypothetical protein
MATGHEFLNMGNSNIAMTEKAGRGERGMTSSVTGGTSRKAGFADNGVVPGIIDRRRNCR